MIVCRRMVKDKSGSTHVVILSFLSTSPFIIIIDIAVVVFVVRAVVSFVIAVVTFVVIIVVIVVVVTSFL